MPDGQPSAKAKAKAKAKANEQPLRSAIEELEKGDDISPSKRRTAMSEESLSKGVKRFLDDRTVGWDKFNVYVKIVNDRTLEQQVTIDMKEAVEKGGYLTPGYWVAVMVPWLPEDHPLKLLKVKDRRGYVSEAWAGAVELADNPVCSAKIRGWQAHSHV